MPRGDGTGPSGMGSMTGRGAGYCAGYNVPGFANTIGGIGYGYGFGRGGGWGRAGRGGHRNWSYSPGLTGWQRTAAGHPAWSAYNPPVPYVQPYTPTKEQEKDMLKNQSKYLEDELSTIQNLLKKLEQEKDE